MLKMQGLDGLGGNQTSQVKLQQQKEQLAPSPDQPRLLIKINLQVNQLSFSDTAFNFSD